jgi:drug/metabolite transporter (DMT)-like permease
VTDRGRGAAFGLSAAVLFGASAPLTKLLLPTVSPLLAAAILYLGAGLALSVWSLIARTGEARLRRADLPILLGIILTGGILGPVLMLVGLGRLSGLSASLLLNLEAPSTMLIAILVFREHLSRREVMAAAVILGGATILGFRPGELHADPWGVLALAGACLSWGVDNNLTQRLSLRDPIAVVRWKALGAGACTLVIAVAMRQPVPPFDTLGALAAIGAISYGASIVLDLYALRLLGAAREAAFFATAPFAGAVLAIPLLGDRPAMIDAAGAAAMLLGVVLLVRARHSHLHTHEELSHEHLHTHDDHHRHEHAPDAPPGEAHSHPHHHATLTHDHPHVSELHHRHKH